MILEGTSESPSDYNWYPYPSPKPSNEEYVEEYYDSYIEQEGVVVRREETTPNQLPRVQTMRGPIIEVLKEMREQA